MLSFALEKHVKAFPAFFISMVKVGEASGKLDIVFDSLAEYYEKSEALARKRKSALIYPIMLLVMTIGIVILMLAFVVPRFRDVLDTLEVEISGYTQAVYNVSDFLLAYWLYLIAGVIVIVGIIIVIGMTKKGAFLYDRIRLRLPLFGKVNEYQMTSNFARSFGILLSSGMDMSGAMNDVCVVLTNKDLKARFELAAEDVRHGMALSTALEKYKVFPKMMIQMIAIGERTAAIDDILLRSCSFFEDQVELALNNLTTWLQPIMLLIMAVVVLGLFLAVYSPMILIMNGLSI